MTGPISALVALALALPAPGEQPQRIDALKSLSIEELVAVEVTTVGRRVERIADVPAAISVVTAEDIRRYASVSLPDALRLADGLHVARVDGRTWAISARGFNISTSNKMLVMMDGRSLWTPLFSGVLWDEHETILADVERIEVVRGPGGTLWGANAINGVINIVSRPAADTLGTYASLTAGTEERLVASVRHGARAGQNGAWRAYAKFSLFDANRLASGEDAGDDQRKGLIGARADWQAGANAFVLQADAYKAALGSFDRDDTGIHGGYVRGRWTRAFSATSDLQVQATGQYSYRHVPVLFEERRRATEIDLQHRFVKGRHTVVSGAGAQITHDRTAPSPVLYFEPADRTLGLFSVFVQDEIALVSNRLWIVPGVKLLRNSYTDVETHPALRLRAVPGRGQSVWAAASHAVRLPSRFDRELRLTGGTGQVLVAGSDDFVSEAVTALEAGYRAQLSRRTSFDATIFTQRYDSLRSQRPGGPVGVSTLANDLNGRSSGLALRANARVTRWLRAQASYVRLATSTTIDEGRIDLGNGIAEFNDPDHQTALRLYANLPRGFELDTFVRYVSMLPHPRVPAYGELDARFGWVSPGGHEIAVVGRNLLHAQHPEFGAPGPRRHEFQRSIRLRTTWRF
jgi:iron complex outermembrane recepter protein